MRRRELIGLLASAAACGSVPALAQAPRKPVVALVLTGISRAETTGPDPAFAPARAFVHELRDLGWIDGQTISIERLSLEGNPQRAPELLADLVARKVDVIVLGGARWLHDAALNATRTIPLITLFQDDPVAAGLIASFARPGGNLTGVAQTTGPEFFRKRLQLLKEIAPRVSRVAFLGPRGVLEQDRQVEALPGVAIVPVPVDVVEQLGAAFDRIRQERADGMMVAGSAITYAYYQRIVAFADENRLPTIHSGRESVLVGGLLSYGTSVPWVFGRMARLTDRVLKGAKPSDLPAERAATFELIINTKTAKMLGLEVPPTMLALADEAI
ncbi:ABC transporter substrate-binding protein [Rhodoplanes sp. Z2-YC6860]|uniref:ABC transporter substrate-binding protein n=1 Tax=Rhodoplanes sp. Z2-YC6860 TaxID=674703 RepID=UPI00078DEC84|nr:ABC transporter substrate-binding protein [Rhodoplanes sp. Z2-YC6860]AMN41936.1 ABC transporter substrate binding protein [Rhodoplanes sp. Z2-YC6860]